MKKVIMINTKTRTVRVENADKNIDWITVKGTHIPIEKGQSKSSAVQKFVESKRGGDSKEKEFIARKTKEWADKSAIAKARTETGKAWRNGEISEKDFIARTNTITEKERASKQQPAKASSEKIKEIDAKIKDKKKELQNIIRSLSENVEDGYFDIAQEMMTDVEYVKGELQQLMDERAKLQQQPAKKERERNWQRGKDEDEDAYFARREKTLAEARKLDKVSDWYGKAYKGDSFGKPKNKNITFKELADGLLSGKIDDFYEAVGTGESDVREKIFQELSERTGRPYDDFYDAWLHGGQKGTPTRKAKAVEDYKRYNKMLDQPLSPDVKKLVLAARDRAKAEAGEIEETSEEIAHRLTRDYPESFGYDD